jgi:ABC-type multidrug transport system fused ATPase/permease subunit
MDEGRIVETGTHEALMRESNGFYKKLHGFQAI